MRIDKLLRSGDVERFHATPGITKQKNSEHQWGVAMLCWYFEPDCRKSVILSALTHDAPELMTGDMPGPTKWAYPELKTLLARIERDVEKEWGIEFELTLHEKHLLKLCDMFEGMQYCIKRYKCGELAAYECFKAWANYVSENYISSQGNDIHFTNKQQSFFSELINQMANLRIKGDYYGS